MESKKIEVPISKRILKNVLKIIFIPLLWAIPLGFLVTINGSIYQDRDTDGKFCPQCIYKVPFIGQRIYERFNKYCTESTYDWNSGVTQTYEPARTNCNAITFDEAFDAYYEKALPLIVFIFWVILLIVFVIYKTFRIKLKE